jgi:hypothetical protein
MLALVSGTMATKVVGLSKPERKRRDKARRVAVAAEKAVLQAEKAGVKAAEKATFEKAAPKKKGKPKCKTRGRKAWQVKKAASVRASRPL